jgi:RimJ/RimL family protein N-acetyltransferase
LISKWLTKPHVQKYFGEPNEWLTEIKENINLDWIKYFIVELDEPIGFAQYYETDKAPQGIWSNQPPFTVGIDYLIGSENFLSKGYGSKLVDLLIEEIKSLNKYHNIIADPIEDNTKSRNLLLKKGFTQLSNGLLRLTI